MPVSQTANGRAEEILEIHVRPGWKKGTKITFPEKGRAASLPQLPALLTAPVLIS